MRALANDEVKTRLAVEGAEALPVSPDEYAADIAAEETKWSEIIRKVGREGRSNHLSTSFRGAAQREPEIHTPGHFDVFALRMLHRYDAWLWIPGSRASPAPRNDVEMTCP